MTYVIDEWNGFERLTFDLAGRKCMFVKPEKREKSSRWLLKTEYFGAFPSFEIEMLKRGWHIAYISNITRWHKPEDDDAKAMLCRFLRKEFKLNRKCMTVGMSCGGMHSVYFAAKYPKLVAAMYLDAPVMNLLSCPCGVGLAGDGMYNEFLNDTGITVSELINNRTQPIDFVDRLIKHRIPAFLVCGDSDTIVPYMENGYYFSEKYESKNIPFKKIVKPGCDHHPHGLEDNKMLIEFAEKYY